MPNTIDSPIVDVRLLGKGAVSALMAGTNEIYVRHWKYSYEGAGTFSLALPKWVNSYGVIMSGGGGGGRAGSGFNNDIGHGGTGGRVRAIWGKTAFSPGRVLSGTIGAGGAGGASSHANGENGGNTTLTTLTSTVYIAEGGTAYPSSGKQDGGTTSQMIISPYHKYFDLPPDMAYHNGPGGKGNGGAGSGGGGGAGGNGGLFNSYTHGGKGGDGFVHIYLWGMHRD